jgi:predicted TIM-barrel fold metal-dependent hydrolase
MNTCNRRQLLEGVGAALLATSVNATAAGHRASSLEGEQEKPEGKVRLALSDFQPRSMLHVPETKVPRARFPVIDIHTHLSWAASSKNGVFLSEKMTYLARPEALLQVMDQKNVHTMVDLTGGIGTGLEETMRRFQVPFPGRFVVFTEPWWERSNQPGYPRFQAVQIERAKKAGAYGLKILKTLGLYLRQEITTGPLVKVDDPRFDPMWEACGALNMPVAIHTSDPEAFFLPIDRFNERFEELNNHPDWSFYDRDFPSNVELLEARNRVFVRHPKTQFIALHVGNDAENLGFVSECLDRFPNMHVDLAARIGELGRQPRTARRFFDKYQDRIFFGTDAVPNGTDTPQQIFGAELYEIYYRFLETEDEYFDYAPAAMPPQGRWRIYGLGLPDSILKKVYYENASRLLGLSIA